MSLFQTLQVSVDRDWAIVVFIVYNMSNAVLFKNVAKGCSVFPELSIDVFDCCREMRWFDFFFSFSHIFWAAIGVADEYFSTVWFMDEADARRPAAVVRVIPSSCFKICFFHVCFLME